MDCEDVTHREVIVIATPQIEAVIDRLTMDKAFHVKYCQDPDATLAVYQLSPEEIRAIKTGDGHVLDELGAGERFQDLITILCGPDPGP